MKKPEITPGKWKLAKSCTIKACPDGKWMHFPEVITEDFVTNPKPLVCQIKPREYRDNEKEAITADNESLANATAIAALPDLLEALERFVTVCDTAPPVEFLHHVSEANKQARQALTKAGYTFN